MTVDVLAIGAHADDVELGIGGLVRKLTNNGTRVALLDLTRAEMSTRGTVDERLIEAQNAAEILGVSERRNAELEDAAVANTKELQRKVIPFIRLFRPKVLLAPMDGDRHPDHRAAHALVRDANYFSGLARIETEQEPYRTPTVFYYSPYYERKEAASMIIDVSAEFETKIEALRAYRSQFYNPDYDGGKTRISSKLFWDSIRSKAAYWGNQIGVDYGETLFSDGPVALKSLPGLEAGP